MLYLSRTYAAQKGLPPMPVPQALSSARKPQEALVAIEGGGTTFAFCLANLDGQIIEEVEVPTLPGPQMLQVILTHIQKWQKNFQIKSLGVAMFSTGIGKEDYGVITAADRKGWEHFNFYQGLRNNFPKVPIHFHNDLSAAALAEYHVRKTQSNSHTENFLYYSIATGIGVAMVKDGKLMCGPKPTEFGHSLVQREEKDNFPSTCQFHKNCLEGLACGAAVGKRKGMDPKVIAAGDPLWNLIAKYSAQALYNLITLYYPTKIICSGGIMQVPGLINKIAHELREYNNGFIPEKLLPDFEKPLLSDDAGLQGALILAQQGIAKLQSKNSCAAFFQAKTSLRSSL